MTSILRAVCALALATGAVAAAPPTEDPELSAGIALAREGDFQGALLKLDEAVRRLEAAGSPPRSLAQGYLYLAIAYLELEQEAPAVERFRAAALRDPDLRLEPSEFSPQVIRFFEAARQEVAAMRAPAKVPPAGGTPRPPAASPPTEKKGSKKVVWAVVGAGAAAAAVTAVALSDGAPASTAATSTTTLPPPAGGRPGAASWTSRLDVPGAAAQVVAEGAVSALAAGRVHGGPLRRNGRQRVDGVLTRAGSAPGAWRFDLAGAAPGSVQVTAGTVAASGPAWVVFSVQGRRGERVSFSFAVP
jgi:hypothetical protein